MGNDITDKTSLDSQIHREGRYNRFINSIQGGYFGIVAFSIAVSGIFGGVALAYIFKDDLRLWQLILSILLVLGNMIIPVAQQKLKPIITLFFISVAVNSFLIIINVFS